MNPQSDPAAEQDLSQPPAAGAAPPAPTAEPAPLGFELPEPARLTWLTAGAALVGLTVVLGGALVAGWLPRREARRQLEASTSGPGATLTRVRVVLPKATSTDRSLLLPGSVQPREETIVHARADGFVRAWRVDIGDSVQEGQLLAEIDTPELDHQLAQARAQLAQADAALAQARATRAFSSTNLDRYKELASKGMAPQQELDQKQAQSLVDDAGVKVAQAAIGAQQANVRRLTQLRSFAKAVAPFAGKITARMIERGALVSSSTPLFRVAAVDTMRVFVHVPQDAAASVRPDVPAKVTLREFPGRVFEGRVSRSAGALDAASRTMQTEVRVPNAGGELMAGMYAHVALSLPSPRRVLEIPATALMNDAHGLRVATVTAEGKIHLVTVVIDRDTGPTIELASGLEGGERVVKLASAELVEGRLVEVVP
jgi:membrane fusion protein, multidrug efflux system